MVWERWWLNSVLDCCLFCFLLSVYNGEQWNGHMSDSLWEQIFRGISELQINFISLRVIIFELDIGKQPVYIRDLFQSIMQYTAFLLLDTQHVLLKRILPLLPSSICQDFFLQYIFFFFDAVVCMRSWFSFSTGCVEFSIAYIL